MEEFLPKCTQAKYFRIQIVHNLAQIRYLNKFGNYPIPFENLGF